MTQELARKVLAELEAMGCSPEELELHRQELFAQFRATIERENDRFGEPDEYLISEGEFAETPPAHLPEEWEELCAKWDEELAWVQAVESAEPPEEETPNE